MFNPFAHALQHMSSLDNLSFDTAHITLHDKGTGREIAAILSYDNIAQSIVELWNAMIIHKDSQNQQISTVSRLWEPLAYSLLFPHGTLGWGLFENQAQLAREIEEEH